MDFIEWNDNFSVNVEELDKQHREMIGIINRLLNSIADEKNDEIVDDILNKLTDFIMTHFETEEHYFDKFNYSKSSDHKAEHRDFAEKVLEFKKKFEEGRESLHLEVTNFLMNWLLNHLLISDREYIECFNENGLR